MDGRSNSLASHTKAIHVSFYHANKQYVWGTIGASWDFQKENLHFRAVGHYAAVQNAQSAVNLIHSASALVYYTLFCAS